MVEDIVLTEEHVKAHVYGMFGKYVQVNIFTQLDNIRDAVGAVDTLRRTIGSKDDMNMRHACSNLNCLVINTDLPRPLRNCLKAYLEKNGVSYDRALNEIEKARGAYSKVLSEMGIQPKI